MPHEASVQPEASTVSTGKSVRYIGTHIYGYSGEVSIGAVQSQDYDLLNFTSGAGYIVARYQPIQYNATNVVYDFQYKIFLNEILVYAFLVESANQYTPYQEVEILIPPVTRVRLTAANPQADAAYNLGAILTGRVYGAV